jgi:hypothetical protein
MLLLVTSSSDPELALVTSRPTVAVVVPAHLSQVGWSYEVGKGALARLVTSRGNIAAGQVHGVLARIQRVWPSELPHIDPDDREYVASEMTAFLAALISDLSCPQLNLPTANSLWGPPWTMEHWWRAATKEGFPICCNYDRLCADLARIVVLGTNTIHSDNTLPTDARDVSVVLAVRAGVTLLECKFCRKHQALQRVSLRPSLSQDLLAAIDEHFVRARRRL